MKLFKLKIENEWDFLTYHVNGKVISDIKEVVVVFKGKKNTYKPKNTYKYSSYSDMGKRFEAKSLDYYIKVNTELGLPINFNLYDLYKRNVKIYVDLKNVSFRK